MRWLCLFGLLLAGCAHPAPHFNGDQDDIVLIRKTLENYMQGTANAEPGKLRAAFHPDFKLYTTDEAGQLRVRDGETYIEIFEDGKQRDRTGSIEMIDVEAGAAIAKVTIDVPGPRYFTDYFLLMKIEGDWKIVQKSYVAQQSPE